MILDIRVGEFRLVVQGGRLRLLRIPLAYGYVWAWTGEWGIWRKATWGDALWCDSRDWLWRLLARSSGCYLAFWFGLIALAQLALVCVWFWLGLPLG